jgi:hypothetical protein
LVSESPLESTGHGLVPTGKGCFVLNACEAPWYERDRRGFYCEFEGFEEHEPDFSQLGINVTPMMAELEASTDRDEERPLVEFYRRRDEIELLVPDGA